ncbi:MAG: helix-turn-helix domain-containing protein [bacterium]
MTEYSLYSESPCTLRNWLRTNRQARHLTLRTVAARLGVSHTWVSKVENGERRLDVFEYVNLCFALGLNPRAGLDLIITARSPYEQSGEAYPNAAEKKPAYGRKKPR